MTTESACLPPAQPTAKGYRPTKKLLPWHFPLSEQVRREPKLQRICSRMKHFSAYTKRHSYIHLKHVQIFQQLLLAHMGVSPEASRCLFLLNGLSSNSGVSPFRLGRHPNALSVRRRREAALLPTCFTCRIETEAARETEGSESCTRLPRPGSKGSPGGKQVVALERAKARPQPPSIAMLACSGLKEGLQLCSELTWYISAIRGDGIRFYFASTCPPIDQITRL